jgi:hypothetical protein
MESFDCGMLSHSTEELPKCNEPPTHLFSTAVPYQDMSSLVEIVNIRVTNAVDYRVDGGCRIAFLLVVVVTLMKAAF